MNNDWKITLLRDLMLLAETDGYIAKPEIVSITLLASEALKLNEEDIIKTMVDYRDIEDIYPTKLEDKLFYIGNLYTVARIDNEIYASELKFIQDIAIDKLGFSEEKTNELLETSLKNFGKGDFKFIDDLQ